MAFDSHKNFAYGTVAGTAPSISGTTLTLAANFNPAPTPPYNITVCPAGTNPTAANAELCRVTANSSGTLTIVRQQEGSTGRAIVVGDQVIAGITAKTVTDIETRVDRIDAQVFYVEDYGAVGDGTTNDTAAIQAAIDACATAGGGTVQFQGRNYAVNSAPRTDRGGNAILAMPQYNIPSDLFPRVVLQGYFGNESGLPGNTGLITTRNDSYDATHGQPSVIGGPTGNDYTESGVSDLYTYMWLTVKDIGIGLPANPAISGIDAKWIACFSLEGFTNIGASPPSGGFGGAGLTHIRQFGVRTPTIANFGYVQIHNLSCFWCFTGLVANSEHLNVENLTSQWCIIGLAPTAKSHSGTIQYYSCGYNAYGISGAPTTVHPVSASGYWNIDMIDVEDAAAGQWNSLVTHIYDTAGTLNGTANIYAITGAFGDTLSITSGSKFRVLDTGLASGYHPITVPASGSSFRVFRDTTFYVSGGTVSAISVDGQTTGMTSGPVTVPSGHPIAITYSSVPTVKAICM